MALLKALLVMMVLIVLMLLALLVTEDAHAIPVAHVVTQSQPAQQLTIIGYEKVTKRKWTWHGRSKRHTYIPIYGYAQTSPIPEPRTYGMLLAGLLLVAYKAKRKL